MGPAHGVGKAPKLLLFEDNAKRRQRSAAALQAIDPSLPLGERPGLPFCTPGLAAQPSLCAGAPVN